MAVIKTDKDLKQYAFYSVIVSLTAVLNYNGKIHLLRATCSYKMEDKNNCTEKTLNWVKKEEARKKTENTQIPNKRPLEDICVEVILTPVQSYLKAPMNYSDSILSGWKETHFGSFERKPFTAATEESQSSCVASHDRHLSLPADYTNPRQQRTSIYDYT